MLCECGCKQETKLATKTQSKCHRIKGQPQRFIHGHNRHKPYHPTFCECGCGRETNVYRNKSSRFISGHNRKRSVYERFWEKVAIDKPDECWEWTAGKDIAGYGTFSINGKNQHASRAAWILIYGPIPNGLGILHSCNNPSCVNPSHLRPGTDQDNVDDCIRAGRNSPPPTIYGEKNNRAKLTDDQVRQVRILFAQGNDTRKQLAKQFNVSVSNIENIVAYRTRTHTT